MNGTNKTIVGFVLGIALTYAALCMMMTLQGVLETGTVSLFLFLPHGGETGIDLADYAGQLTGLYGEFLGLITGYVPEGYGDYASAGLVVAGFALMAAGCLSKYSLDVKGTDNPAEYMWTHRPKAFVRCLQCPWGLIFGTWHGKHKALVVIPVLLIPLYLPWSVMAMLFTVLPFAVMKGVKSASMKSKAKKDGKQYDENITYGVCPRCKRNFHMPKVRCKCGLVLDYPVPNEYGVKYHTCNNGHRIDCSSRMRSGLDTVCPYCGADIQTREAKTVSVAMVGAVGSGKTTLMLATVKVLSECGRKSDVVVDAITPGISKSAVAAKDVAPRSATGELDSECLFIRDGTSQEREIVFNDISGQEFEPKEDKDLFEEYFTYSDGIVFTFDPLSLTNSSRGYTPMETFESFHSMYTQIRGIGPGKVSNVPFAVVATKNDVARPRLEDGDVREYLIEHGQDGFVRVVESLFSNIRYFAVSSKGDDCMSAVEPVWWIIGQKDPTLKESIKLQ